MRRVFFTVVALAAFPLGSRAQEAVVHLTVRPMAAPKPALKYQLLPELRELKPGNSAQNYLKCFMEQRYFFFTKQAADERASYLAMPLADLPVDKLRNYGGSVLRQADWAARLDTVDWQALERFQNGGMESLADELGPIQILAVALQIRFRGRVAGRQFDDAIANAKTMFALGRHLGEHPSEVANLIGLWVAHLGLGTLEEMVQQPGCPNLYWALTDLPCPLVDVRKGVQGDRTVTAANFRSLHDDTAMTGPEIAKFVSDLSGLIGLAREQSGRSPRNLRARFEARVKDKERVIAARRRLVEAGYGPDLVETFKPAKWILNSESRRFLGLATLPPAQVILLDEKRDYEIQRDERMKLLSLPLWQFDSCVGGKEWATDGDGLFADLLPHIVKLRQSQGRLEQQIALLRLVEALRLYAAEHHGAPPPKLSDVSVPPPIDPVTGKSFQYSVDGSTAHIRGGSVRADLKNPGSEVHYLVTLQK